MNVGDVMTQEVISVAPESTVAEAAKLMLAEGVSGLPVINESHVLVGMVTDGDFMRRAEIGTEKTRPHWLELLTNANILAGEYVRSHARLVSEVMTRNVAVATEDMPLEQAVTLMEERRVKRLPVVRGKRVVGIVARANLLRALAAGNPLPDISPTDATIQDQVVHEVRSHHWGRSHQLQVIVKDGVVDLWGVVTQERQRHAIRLAAENVHGVRLVRDHMLWFEPSAETLVDPGVTSAHMIIH